MRTIRYGITVIGLLLTLFLFTACAAQAPTESPVQDSPQGYATEVPYKDPLIFHTAPTPSKEYCRVTVRGEVRLGTSEVSYIYNESVHDLMVKENPSDLEWTSGFTAAVLDIQDYFRKSVKNINTDLIQLLTLGPRVTIPNEQNWEYNIWRNSDGCFATYVLPLTWSTEGYSSETYPVNVSTNAVKGLGILDIWVTSEAGNTVEYRLPWYPFEAIAMHGLGVEGGKDLASVQAVINSSLPKYDARTINPNELTNGTEIAQFSFEYDHLNDRQYMLPLLNNALLIINAYMPHQQVYGYVSLNNVYSVVPFDSNGIVDTSFYVWSSRIGVPEQVLTEKIGGIILAFSKP